MTVQSNDDFTNRELSIEELDAIAGGDWFTSVLNFFEGPAGLVEAAYNALGLGNPSAVHSAGTAHRNR